MDFIKNFIKKFLLYTLQCKLLSREREKETRGRERERKREGGKRGGGGERELHIQIICRKILKCIQNVKMFL